MCKYCGNNSKSIFELNYDNINVGVSINYSRLAHCHCLDLAIGDAEKTYSCANKIKFCPFCGYEFLDFE